LAKKRFVRLTGAFDRLSNSATRKRFLKKAAQDHQRWLNKKRAIADAYPSSRLVSTLTVSSYESMLAHTLREEFSKASEMREEELSVVWLIHCYIPSDWAKGNSAELMRQTFLRTATMSTMLKAARNKNSKGMRNSSKIEQSEQEMINSYRDIHEILDKYAQTRQKKLLRGLDERVPIVNSALYFGSVNCALQKKLCEVLQKGKKTSATGSFGDSCYSS